MQSRRNVVVAVVIVTIQVLSLAVATDILGADVSDYASRTETIEAVGADGDDDRSSADGDGGLTDLVDDEVWSAIDLSVVDSDDPVPGLDIVPDQLALVDQLRIGEEPEVAADPTIEEPPVVLPAKGPAAVETPTTIPDSTVPDATELESSLPVSTVPESTVPVSTGAQSAGLVSTSAAPLAEAPGT
ncbi:MAG: hypothetical protein ACR2QK_12535, partial [Acidimicrobiales bacterium]